ncbi:MAG: tetratricopeptide repeat protein, partial [Planctomycetes bacterium]|nr:tetratricopeptide repeat protein [Planctomycetota bacterium]
RPGYVDATHNLGLALLDQGHTAEAVTYFRQTVRLLPQHGEAYHNLGLALAAQEQMEEAVEAFEQALQLRPQDPRAHFSLGVALGKLGKHAEAVTYFQQSLKLQPLQAEVYNNLGFAFAEQGNLDEAVACYRQAVQLRPNYPEAFSNLGNALRRLGRFAEAEASLQQALAARPDYPEAHNNLAVALAEQRKLTEALPHYAEAIRLRPDYADAHKNRSLAWLVLGDFTQGFEEFEWRWKSKGFLPRSFPQPLWDGSPLEGRTILLHGEQGIGDILQFVRYAPLVQEHGGRVLLECPGGILPLLRTCPGIDRLLTAGTPLPAFDCHLSLMSLPRVLGTTPATIPGNVPYLFADPGLIAYWQQELGDRNTFKVGIVWQGNPKFPADQYRSFPLARLAPLAQVPQVQLFSLQKGPGVEQMAAVADQFPVVDLGGRLDQNTGAFLDTAAVMKNLDLVVTCDTAAGHLAGALGVPVWLALSYAGDWRWLLDREDSPWYPTLRLFRQSRLGDWETVFDRMAEELKKLLASPRPVRPILVEISPGELIDKITILEIKSERMTDADKLRHVRLELAALTAARDRVLARSEELQRLTAELRAVNEKLWDIEDAIRACERRQDFGPHFTELARSVYRNNDQRAAWKRRINDLLGSRLVEEKAYSSYD